MCPPFITTLAGQLIFRDLSNFILNGRTQTVNVQALKNIFGGGATCYVPDFLGGGEGLNLLCVVVGVLACAAFLALGGLGTMAWTIRLWRKHKAHTVSEATEDTNQACVSMERRKVSSCRRLSSRE